MGEKEGWGEALLDFHLLPEILRVDFNTVNQGFRKDRASQSKSYEV